MISQTEVLPQAPEISAEPLAGPLRDQLDRILASSCFSRSERLSRFLRLIVEETIAGREGELKEYTIGTRVYDRGAGFDPTVDTIVRVEARRLRATLSSYFAAEGSVDPIRIEVPKGGYRPVFRWNTTPPEVAPAASLPSVAVLPFENFGADHEEKSFCDDIAEEIINSLTQVEGIRVAARISVLALRRLHQDVRSIGQALNVGAIVGGSVRKAGDHVRIMAQLIDISDGYQLWSRRFHREMTDVFSVQDEVAGAVAHAVRIRLVDSKFHEGENSWTAP